MHSSKKSSQQMRFVYNLVRLYLPSVNLILYVYSLPIVRLLAVDLRAYRAQIEIAHQTAAAVVTATVRMAAAATVMLTRTAVHGGRRCRSVHMLMWRPCKRRRLNGCTGSGSGHRMMLMMLRERCRIVLLIVARIVDGRGDLATSVVRSVVEIVCGGCRRHGRRRRRRWRQCWWHNGG